MTCAVLILTCACGMPIGYSAVILPQLYNSSDPLSLDIEMGSWISMLKLILKSILKNKKTYKKIIHTKTSIIKPYNSLHFL